MADDLVYSTCVHCDCSDPRRVDRNRNFNLMDDTMSPHASLAASSAGLRTLSSLLRLVQVQAITIVIDQYAEKALMAVSLSLFSKRHK
jgi:hypothetical protein